MPEQKALLDYLNHLPTARFTSLRDTIPAVEEEASRMYRENLLNKEGYDACRRTLRDIDHCPKPFYQPAEYTMRPFAIGNSLQNLQSDLRQKLCLAWAECDLKSAHLAIVAALWKVPEVMDFLRSGQSIWTSLCRASNLPETPENKAALKDILYALVYGDIKCSLTRRIHEAGIANHLLFYSHPVIAAMLVARDKRLEEIKKAGNITDCFGNTITKSKTIGRGDTKREAVDARSLMALECQAIEFKLMYPIVELAIECQAANNKRGFVITLWQFDGCSLCFEHQREKVRLMQKVKKAVDENAREMGIPTSLEWKTNPWIQKSETGEEEQDPPQMLKLVA